MDWRKKSGREKEGDRKGRETEGVRRDGSELRSTVVVSRKERGQGMSAASSFATSQNCRHRRATATAPTHASNALASAAALRTVEEE